MPPFLVGEPQEEALARIDYLRARGGGWCELAGPQGIGKSFLLEELARRAIRRGERRACLDLGPLAEDDWFRVLADAWQIDVPPAGPPLEVRRRIEDHLAGLRAMNQTAWLFLDDDGGGGEKLIRGCRWLRQASRRLDCRLMIVSTRLVAGDSPAASDDVDLRVELWPWEPRDCQFYVEAVNRTTPWSAAAIGALCDRSDGIPRAVAKLVEWTRAAAETESLAEIDADLVHAVADELFPREPARPNYEASAAYGAW